MIYDEKELTILRAAENLLAECNERIQAQDWPRWNRAAVLSVGTLRGKAASAYDALQAVRIHHQVNFTADAPEPVTEESR